MQRWVSASAGGVVVLAGILFAPRESMAQTFANIGDYGKANQTPIDHELEVANLVKSWNPDFITTVGDNNYENGASSTIDANIGQYYHDYIGNYAGSFGAGSPVALGNRFFPALGNHDWRAAGASPYLNYFTLPGNERYYDYVKGNVHFFVLDSDPNEPDGDSSHQVQGQWLKSGLQSSTSKFNVVYMHHAPYSSGTEHGSNKGMQWQFKQWGATSVLAGHDHDYERFNIGGIPYFVNGSGGNPTLYPIGAVESGSQFRDDTHWGAQKITATTTQMKFEFYSTDGVLRDSFTQNAPVIPIKLRTFQQGTIDGGIAYQNTQDTYLDAGNPSEFAQGTGGMVVSDGSPVNQALVRFDDIFGNGANQVPAGATITQATLTLVTGSATNDLSGANINLHRVLKTWSENSSYADSAFQGDGITLGDEAASVAEASITADILDTAMHFDVTATLQAWANNPSQNFGWTLINNGTDGWRFVSSEGTLVTARPMLEVSYAVPEPVLGALVIPLLALMGRRRHRNRLY